MMSDLLKIIGIFQKSVQGIILTDSEGTILNVNQAITKITGYQVDELLGRNPRIFQSGRQNATFYEQLWEEVKEKGYWQGEIWNQRKDGEEYLQSLNIIAINDEDSKRYFLAISSDITEQRKNEGILRLSSKVIDSLTEGVLITDSQRKIIFINPAFTKVTGYSADEVIGKNPRILQSGRHSIEFYREMNQSIYHNGNWSGEIWNRRKNGEIYPEWLNINVLKNECGEITHYVGVFSDITVRKKTEQQLEHLAHYDILTDLPNRSLFEERLNTALLHARQKEHYIALIFLDLDRFKAVNDTLGHSFGDRLLCQVSQRLKNSLCAADIVSRWGGDEFTIMLDNITTINHIEILANRVIQNISSPYIIEGHEIAITSSIGISIFPNDGQTTEELMVRADTAMYLAKRQENTFRFYSSEVNKKGM